MRLSCICASTDFEAGYWKRNAKKGVVVVEEITKKERRGRLIIRVYGN
jgi:hypothetical protein